MFKLLNPFCGKCKAHVSYHTITNPNIRWRYTDHGVTVYVGYHGFVMQDNR